MEFDLPPVYLLATHLKPEELHDLEGKVPSLTDNIREAEIIVGRISKRERALFELGRGQVYTDPVVTTLRKRKRSSSENDINSALDTEDANGSVPPQSMEASSLAHGLGNANTVKVGRIAPLHGYLLYEGCKKDVPETPATVKASGIISRAAAGDASQTRSSIHPVRKGNKLPADMHRTMSSLTRRTTSEHDSALKMPPVLSFIGTNFACSKATPVRPLNVAFVDELKKVRIARTLVGHHIGVRAYSTSIATISAYPYAVAIPQEVARLPGFGARIAELWREWKKGGRLHEADEAQADYKLSVIKTGWRNLDGVVKHGWDSLSRVQQIDVRYYEEFKVKIPRTEVKYIADYIFEHARQIDSEFQLVIMGGYRRGKQGSGDVDVVISHPDEAATMHIIEKLVVNLEKSHHITHTLMLSNRNSERGQQLVSWKGNELKGNNFDTLDKALLVWQPPETKSQAYSGDAEARTHRRVDIVISPWKTAGCAVLGWSGDTTFQRDKGFKLDSSGIRSRLNGSWIDLERVFEELGLDDVPPEDRCTG
ncbi:Nucleotidyltransferase [Colletotrichum falcatum]|nr:Nucleotidyltransferase [Colletotrichum falcatum]